MAPIVSLTVVGNRKILPIIRGADGNVIKVITATIANAITLTVIPLVIAIIERSDRPQGLQKRIRRNRLGPPAIYIGRIEVGNSLTFGL